jgi:hypothetical protein
MEEEDSRKFRRITRKKEIAKSSEAKLGTSEISFTRKFRFGKFQSGWKRFPITTSHSFYIAIMEMNNIHLSSSKCNIFDVKALDLVRDTQWKLSWGRVL